jgi:transcriptional regulator with XRE-family HTH domain
MVEHVSTQLEILRTRMQEIGMSQRELADIIGLHQSAVSNILRGARQIKVHEWNLISDALGFAINANKPVPFIALERAAEWEKEVGKSDFQAFELPLEIGGDSMFAVEYNNMDPHNFLRGSNWVVVDPEETDLFSGDLYLAVEKGKTPEFFRYADGPARLLSVSGEVEPKVIPLGRAAPAIIGRVEAILRRTDVLLEHVADERTPPQASVIRKAD